MLDVDYHHGNGTQAIFYARGDVQVVNIHADPLVEYPYFLGHADERGAGEGEGCNLNLPLPHGTDFAAWSAALETGCGRWRTSRRTRWWCRSGSTPIKGDPISQFRLDTAGLPADRRADPRRSGCRRSS